MPLRIMGQMNLLEPDPLLRKIKGIKHRALLMQIWRRKKNPKKAAVAFDFNLEH